MEYQETTSRSTGFLYCVSLFALVAAISVLVFVASVGAEEKPKGSRGQVLMGVTTEACEEDCIVRVEAAVAPHMQNYLLVLLWASESGAGDEKFFKLPNASASHVYYIPGLRKGEHSVRALLYRRPDISKPHDEVSSTVRVGLKPPVTTNIIRFGREP